MLVCWSRSASAHLIPCAIADVLFIMKPTPEHDRLASITAGDSRWRTWGTYLAERAWGAVPVDYSADGDAWDFFPHDHARMRAYRWHEDGLAGFCDDQQQLCLGLALWNGQDPILKERLWGLAGGSGPDRGSHGEDVKELYFYQEATPTHSYNRMRYLYPQTSFPFDALRNHNQDGNSLNEVELHDVLRDEFNAGRHFQVDVEYAKAGPDDIVGRIRVTNHGPTAAPIHVLPQIWYRNTWSWGSGTRWQMGRNTAGGITTDPAHPMGERQWAAEAGGTPATLLFTENDSNNRRLWPGSNQGVRYAKDAFHLCVVPAERAALERANGCVLQGPDAVNPQLVGSKAAAWFQRTLAPGETWEIRVRLAPSLAANPFADADQVLATRQAEADAYYSAIQPAGLDPDHRLIQRQAFAGLLWSRQFYAFDVSSWLDGDPGQYPPPASRRQRKNLKSNSGSARNVEWRHLTAHDVITMPDAWEYPWFAAWDLAFHSAAVAPIDIQWAKDQLLLLLKPRYMHPSGQIPAYEWEFSDLNPPVTGWAGLMVYRREKAITGRGDTDFLANLLTPLVMNYTWWTNREDLDGDDVFQGGFLGLDNISIVDRSSLAPGEVLEQTDATAWMAMYAGNLLEMALELAESRPEHADMAVTFLDHYVRIATVLHNPSKIDTTILPLWDEQDGFFYSRCIINGEEDIQIRIRSMVGLAPLFASTLLTRQALEAVPRLGQHLDWLQMNRPEAVAALPELFTPNEDGHRLLSLLPQVRLNRLSRVLDRMFDDGEFLSPYGIRSLSRAHLDAPFECDRLGAPVRYQSGVSTGAAKIKGGNSNWRGPVWMPVNALIVQALRVLGRYHGDTVQVAVCEAGSKHKLDLASAAENLTSRLVGIFAVGDDGHRPVYKDYAGQPDPLFAGSSWRDQVLFFEYFDGDTGKGLGASHQTGWTAMVAALIQDAQP